MKKIFSKLIIILAIVLVGFLAGITLTSKPDPTIGVPLAGRGVPISIYWVAQDKQSMAQSSEGKFSVKAYLITKEGISFFYTMQAAQKGSPKFVGLSSTISETGEQINEPLKVNKTQNLGKMADFEIGVVQVEWIDRVKQVIMLQVTPPGSDKYVWQVAPLKQNSANPGKTEINWHSAQAEPYELKITSGATVGNSYALVKVVMLDRCRQIDPTIPALFFNIDRQASVLPLTEAEYDSLSAAAIKPTTPGPDDLKPGRVPTATTAPTEPPQCEP